MRNLDTSDIFTFSRMILKMGLKEDLKAFLARIKKPKIAESEEVAELKTANVEEALDMVMLVLEKMVIAEKEFYDFVAPIAETDMEGLKKMPLNELVSLLRDIYMSTNFISFLQFPAQQT